jgi:hypothetical protein
LYAQRGKLEKHSDASADVGSSVTGFFPENWPKCSKIHSTLNPHKTNKIIDIFQKLKCWRLNTTGKYVLVKISVR